MNTWPGLPGNGPAPRQQTTTTGAGVLTSHGCSESAALGA
jgi:hypothetical protein